MVTAAQRLATGRYGEAGAARWLSQRGMVVGGEKGFVRSL